MGRRRGLSESGKDRRALAADAGFGSLSIGSILAGVLVAYGAFAVLVGIAAVIVDALNVDTDIVTTDYEQLGIVGGLIVAGLLLLSYLFGGYVAGRMARRAGVLNGLLVAILGLAIAGGVAALVRASDAETINTSLRSLGVPTTADEYGQAFTVAGIASLAAILIGSLLGGSLGERWHGKLLARAVNPDVGTEADARRRAQADMARAEQERTLAFDRARTSNPARARRVDRDALSDADRRALDDDGALDDVDDRNRTSDVDRTVSSTPLVGRRADRSVADDRSVGDRLDDDGRGHNVAGGNRNRVVTGRRAETMTTGSRDRRDDAIVADALVDNDDRAAVEREIDQARDREDSGHRRLRGRRHRNGR